MSLISESEPHLLYRFITQSEIFQAFISWDFDDYGLQIIQWIINYGLQAI